MLRYYVCPKDVWSGDHEFAGGIVMPRHNLFHTAGGSHYIDLPDGLILLSTDFDDHRNEATWHNQFQVARLAHPVHEKDVPLHHLHSRPGWEHKGFARHHHTALKRTFNLSDHHHVWDLHDRAVRVNPLCRLDTRY